MISEVYAATVPIGNNFGFGQIAGQDPTLASVIQVLVPLGFSVATIMVMFYFIIAALELITSQGDKAHIVSARSKIYHSIIGFVLLIAIFIILQYVIPAIVGQASTFKII